MTEHSESAMAYVQVQRRSKDLATWMDVAEAYDAGMRHGTEARRNAVKQLDRGPKCKTCGFDEKAGIHSEHLIGRPAPMNSGEYHVFTPEAA